MLYTQSCTGSPRMSTPSPSPPGMKGAHSVHLKSHFMAYAQARENEMKQRQVQYFVRHSFVAILVIS